MTAKLWKPTKSGQAKRAKRWRTKCSKAWRVRKAERKARIVARIEKEGR